MPTQTTILARVCESNFGWSTKVLGSTDYYDVRYTRTDHGPMWTCTCKGFQFRNKCKHLAGPQHDICSWGREAFSGSPQEANDDDTCPKCGGPTRVIEVAI